MALFLLLLSSSTVAYGQSYDVLVYGGTPAGVIASVAAARNGARVLLVEQTQHLGGMNSSGLNTAESEHMINKAITGLAREFYTKVGRNFSEEYFLAFRNGRNLNFRNGDPAFFFESHVAERVFNEMIEEAGIDVQYGKRVEEAVKQDHTIQEVRFTDGTRLSARIYIDCTYEGDLMARSGVSYTYGRESAEQYGESFAGIRFMDDTLSSRTVGEQGRLLPYFSEGNGLVIGQADQRVMNYNFRPTMTQAADKVEVTRPSNYDSTRYQLLADYLAAKPDTEINDLIGIYARGNGKFEFNNQQHATISLGLFGGNTEYPDADYPQRDSIYQDHKDYTLGYLYFLGHDPRVPPKLQKHMRSFGFARDEFADNNHFPYYLYVREARRMIGQYVMTQSDIIENRSKPEAVTIGSHWIDSHHVQRVAVSDSSFTNEGRIWYKVTQPFELPYPILLPKPEEADNLLVPVCASLSHVAFCAYRLESTWMQMGHVAGTAAALAARLEVSPSSLSIEDLQYQLRVEGMIMKTDRLGAYDDYPEASNP